MSEVYLSGRSLISALGDDLRAAVDGVTEQRQAVTSIGLPDGSTRPYFAIAHADPSWRARARTLVRTVVEQAGIGALCDAPLFVASSSLQMGAIETGEATLAGDYADFADDVARWLDWRGPVYIVSTACTSSLNALLAASAQLNARRADDAIVLGIELANRYTLAGFAAMQLLSAGAPRPLGLGRDGLALGEAVAVLHLSRRPSRWRLRGGASLVDGRDPTGARAETVARLCRDALADAGLTPAAIDLVKVQAAGSIHGDANEVAGLVDVFASLPPLTSFKGALGHTLGASGAAELALLIACLERGAWPVAAYPPDPAAGATLAMMRPPRVRQLLALILGFGGGYAAVALEDTDA